MALSLAKLCNGDPRRGGFGGDRLRAPTREEPCSHRTIDSLCGSAHALSHQGTIALQDFPYIFLSYNGCYWAES